MTIPWLAEVKARAASAFTIVKHDQPGMYTPKMLPMDIAPERLLALIAIAEGAQELYFHIEEASPWRCRTGEAVERARKVP